MIVPEEHGGLGLGAVELVVIQEEMGYALAPSPFLSSVCAALLLVAARDRRAARALAAGRWLSGEARGTRRRVGRAGRAGRRTTPRSSASAER